MTYDAELADRVREALASEPELGERKMFGGLAFLIDGRMAAAARGGGGLMVRVGPAAAARFVETTPAEYVEMRGGKMKGWLHLDAADLESDDELEAWLARAVDFTTTLQPTT